MKKLPKLFKKKWVAALRSGKFKQNKGQLVNYATLKPTVSKTRFCCLGVAEYICGTPIVKMNGRGLPGFLKNPQTPKILHLKHDKSLAKKLARFNDANKSFNWIASYIERYL